MASPQCLICRRDREVQFVVFTPRFLPFGSVCVACESELPRGVDALERLDEVLEDWTFHAMHRAEPLTVSRLVGRFHDIAGRLERREGEVTDRDLAKLVGILASVRAACAAAPQSAPR